MGASVVQTAIGSCSPGVAATATLSSTPTPDNVLLVLVGYYIGQTLTPQSGLVLRHSANNGNAALAIYSRLVQFGDPTAWTINESGSDSMTVAVAEVVGSDGSPAGWTYRDTPGGGGSASDTATLAAAQLGLAFATSDGGAGNGVSVITPTGYSIDQSAIPTNHTGVLGEFVGTGSPETIATAWNGSPDPLVQTVIEVHTPTVWHPPNIRSRGRVAVWRAVNV